MEKQMTKITFLAWCAAILLLGPPSVFSQNGFLLRPVSGADGVFETVKIGGQTVHRSISYPDRYEYYMYFQCDQEVRQRTVYLEVEYLDIGYGNFRVEYNSITDPYDRNAAGFQNYVQDSQRIRTAVFELPWADFRDAQNVGADFRLSTDGTIQMHIIKAHLYLEPTPAFLKYREDWMSPYSGPDYFGDNAVDAATLIGKVICGYQGWFRAAGDPSGAGWVHYVSGNFNDLSVEMWPDMLEYSHEEQYPVPGWTYGDGSQATLFSSANRRTVLRHFQWMQAYGIDGAAVQRFGAGLDKRHFKESFRIPGYAREAANRTGRVYYIMYDMSGMNPAQMADLIGDDWHFFVDSMKITADARYLRHSGKPVVSVYGFYPDRFEAKYANQVLDLFQNGGPYEAFVIGSGLTPWRTETASGWPDVFRRMDAYTPWNVGNFVGDYAQTSSWANDKSAMTAAGAIYMPLVYPGFSWDNLMNQPPGTTYHSRLEGVFLWRQFLDAKKIGAQAVYVAMFDEIDEGTAIFKVTNDIPVNHPFKDYEGLPSDFYLLMAGYGTKIIRGELSSPASMPDFAGQSQPSIPEILSPSYDDSVNKEVRISWAPARHASGVRYYELDVDRGGAVQLPDTFAAASLSAGTHAIRVRAVNGLLNRGGWSETVVLYAREKPAATVTFTVSTPANTPAADTIYIAGNFNAWDPGPEQAGIDGAEHDLPMHKTGENQWQIALPVSIGFSLEYKYTRGGWGTVENGEGGVEIPNRRIIVPGADYIENDAVASWADIDTYVAGRDAGEPAAFQLSQNYPNPYNEATVIRYVIPRSTRVRMEMINVRGETVKRLVDQFEESGSHQFILNSAALPSGIYFITITAGNDAAFRKILLVR